MSGAINDYQGDLYGISFTPVRFKTYKPSSQQAKRGLKGRWQEMSEYGGWTNCRAPDVIVSGVDAVKVALAAPELLEALIETRTSLMIVAEQVLSASKSDPRWDGVYEKLTPYLEQARAAITKATGETQ